MSTFLQVHRKNVYATLILLIIDVLWIGLYMGKQYTNQVQSIQKTEMKVHYLFAICSYMLMIVGLNMFVLPNIRKGNELKDSIKYGFVFGIVLYGVYDFTAGAVLEKWDKKLMMIDILWGGFAYFISSYVGSMLAERPTNVITGSI